MTTEPIPKIEPLINDLKNLGSLGDFLRSQDFKRYLIKVRWEESWNNAYKFVENERGYFAVGFDHAYFDSIDAMILILNKLYSTYNTNFYHFIHDILLIYTQWSKKDLDTNDILMDMKLLNPPEEIIAKIEFLGNYYSKPVPKTEIPIEIWNSEKLDSILKKMDSSINNGDYNQTITCAYSCLEGLFKAFIFEKIPDKKETEKLNQLAILVRNFIKNKLETESISYPEQMLMLITTVTNAISNARNSFSDSHFDGESERWLAEFARDCVNSIGRLVLKFIK